MTGFGVGEGMMFRLRAGAVECDGDGLRIAGISLLDRSDGVQLTKTCDRPPAAEIEARLSRAYGRAIGASAKLAGLRVVAEALNRGELARGQIAALLLKLPEPPPRGAPSETGDVLDKRLHECGWLLKDWDPDKHPRAGVPPNAGGFVPTDGGDGAAKPTGAGAESGGGSRTVADSGAGITLAQTELGVDPSLLFQGQSPDAVRKRIVEIAESLIGSQQWAKGVWYGFYRPGSNKCFLFVADVLNEAGADPGTPNVHDFTFRPPFAGQWADPTFNIPGWRVLGPDEAWAPGDVVAQQIGYGNASGHVMIIGEGNTFVGTGSHGNGPSGTIEQIPWQKSLTDDLDVSTGPLVYRRWVGK